MCSPRVAAKESSKRQPRSSQCAVNLDRLDPVVAACRIMSADPMAATNKSKPRRDGELVKADQFCKKPGHAAV